jgi:hypothetical protein
MAKPIVNPVADKITFQRLSSAVIRLNATFTEVFDTGKAP